MQDISNKATDKEASNRRLTRRYNILKNGGRSYRAYPLHCMSPYAKTYRIRLFPNSRPWFS